jgi:PIN domain nuclease of toxin-antitoxin system
MILLDTQAVIWLMTDKGKLSASAADRIRRANRAAEGVAIASLTLWEVAMVYRKGGIRTPNSLGKYLTALERAFLVLPVTAAIAERTLSFSDRYPRDPMDRIIGATAIVHEAQLVTSDRVIRASGEVDCVW